jgi:hypothetical protein
MNLESFFFFALGCCVAKGFAALGGNWLGAGLHTWFSKVWN